MDERKETGIALKKATLKLMKSYEFEGETVSELDFSGMVDMTAKNMMRVDRILVSSGNVSLSPETTLAYSLAFAAEATGRPVEFFESLAPFDAIAVKNVVTNFLSGQGLTGARAAN